MKVARRFPAAGGFGLPAAVRGGAAGGSATAADPAAAGFEPARPWAVGKTRQDGPGRRMTAGFKGRPSTAFLRFLMFRFDNRAVTRRQALQIARDLL